MSTQIAYHLGPDSHRQAGVPRGTITQFQHVSQVYPDIRRDYWVYVPQQYDAAKPAALMVFQDGRNYCSDDRGSRAHIVFDNLIHTGEMPVTIGVFLNPGQIPAAQPDQKPRSNRSFEYDSLGGEYARFLIEEVLPGLQERHSFRVTDVPDLRAIGGISSGGICAFTVAWERPEHFSTVLSTVGSFTNIRGGHKYPDIIRENSRKPIRVFFQDGRNDNRGQRRGGKYDPEWDWFLQNVRMVEALTEKGYDVNYSWSIGTHGLKPGGVILPEMMPAIWRPS